MLSLGLPSNPPPDSPQPDKPVRLRSTRYGEMEEHELVRLLDSINDERARARFRESIYISLFVWIAIAWFLFYGPQLLFHTPRLIDPSVLLRRQHNEEIAQLSLPPNLRRVAPRPAPPAKPPAVDTKTLEHLRATAPVPAPAPTPPPPPPPPVTQPTVPSPVPPPPPAPTPQPARAPQPAAVPDAPAPSPTLALNRPISAGEAIRNATTAVSRGGFPTGPTNTPHRPGLSAGPKIISDTQGVDFTSYMQRLHAIIEHSWLPLLPESINPPISAHGITGIDFKILPNGDLGGITIISKSGETALDRAAFNSIVSSGKFPPLPKEFHGPLLELQCGFLVNQPDTP